MNISPYTALESASAEELAGKMAALAHPTRIAIVRYLSGSGHCCCKEVVKHLDLAQSTVSQHLKILVEAGLVRFSPDRQRSRYEVDGIALAKLQQDVFSLVKACCPPADAAKN